ncbi:MAG: response regulator [Symploca sp. SIO1C4]|uniref:histidine kinase n=1 Tax=Symploca sp. SIO1C4 TaxID=2607765 RepID=A0A6B3NEL1_9CYAN|nr:response regulator [Symploca sp. SIO1C4]
MVRARILVVEDESIVALSIQNRLEALGYAVAANLPSGEAAVKTAGETRPDLVLMDIRLRGKIDGIQAADQIRNRFQIPVVYLTAYTDEETINRAKFTEPYGYILKPFEPRDLCTTIEIALYKHQMELERGQREQSLSTALNSVGDAVITTDQEELVTFMNPVAEGLTGWKCEEVVGDHLSEVFKTINIKTREIIEHPIALVLHEGVTINLEFDTLLINKNGDEILITETAAPLKNKTGQIIGAALIFHESTGQQQIAVTLEKTNQELEVKLAESTAQLQQANEQLWAEIPKRQRLEQELQLALEKEQELEQIKSQLLATISQEYRTPLATILSSSQLLERYSSRWTDKKKHQHLQRIQATVEQLTKLSNDAAFIKDAEARNLGFQPVSVDVKQLVRDVISEFVLSANTKDQILCECQTTETRAFLDKRLVRSIINNLLSNAVKYSFQGSRVQLEIELHQGESAQVGHQEVVFRISDQGIGIPSADQDQIFQAFFRGSNVNFIPGAGLGLAIVKASVELHRGTISIDSEVGVGTTVTVTLPWQEE